VSVQSREARTLAVLNNGNQHAYRKIAEQWDTLAAELENAHHE
jgi:hypothetical protein